MPNDLTQLIYATAGGIGFPPAVAYEQLKLESANFRPDVIYGPFIGGAGERGLAQFIPGTWQRFGSGNPYNPQNSLDAWQRYISYLSGLFPGDLAKILQAYNGGEGNVQRGTVSTAAKNYAATILSRSGQTAPVSVPILDLSGDPQADEFSLANLSIFGMSPALSILSILGASAVLIAFLSSED